MRAKESSTVMPTHFIGGMMNGKIRIRVSPREKTHGQNRAQAKKNTSEASEPDNEFQRSRKPISVGSQCLRTWGHR